MSGTEFCYWHSLVGPQQGSFCTTLLAPIGDGAGFRSKGTLYSLIREWRGGSSRSRARAAHALLTGHGRGCFIGILGSGAGHGVLAWRAQLCRSGSRSQCRVQGLRTARRRHLELSAVVALLRMVWAEVLARPFRPRNAGLEGRAWGLCSGILWASETRWSTKEKKVRFVSLPRFYFYFPETVSGLSPWQHVFDKCLLNERMNRWVNE